MTVTFFLGTHKPGWLADARFAAVPLFVSRSSLASMKRLPRAAGHWALDGSGFTMLQINGRWTMTSADYVAEVRRFRDEIGGLAWAAPMDWMCEPAVIAGLVVKRPSTPCRVCVKAGRRSNGKAPLLRTMSLDTEERPTLACDLCGARTIGKAPQIHVGRWRAWAETAGKVMAGALGTAIGLGIDAVVMFHGTGLSVEEHQRRTVANFVELRALAPDLPIIPVLQGWSIFDYWRCVDLYADAGVDLRAEPVVGVGSVCRRQGTGKAETIMRSLASSGLRLHGFGFKVQGLQGCADVLASADSLAWSIHARKRPPLHGHDKPGAGRRTGHKNCANCAEYALSWRADLLSGVAGMGEAA